MYQDYVHVDMPTRYSQADAAWIQAQLFQLPPSLRLKIALRYTEVFEAAFEAESVSFRQENQARHEANTRLRKFVREHGRAIQGYTTSAPLAGAQRRS
ncbi:hypothetical protein M942_08485 [Enterobacter ludwigii]|jgi:hypothetical protein|uniref:hypothetical protein n=1 Tax=Enterobacter ludwigii TaxID=299767 RepID=UPI0003D7D972|nr:hypothetical protein [Enterobacter ludwigii]AHE69772.1 hypothetical protein M942_08485 [Enterobacter ludwigii]